MARGPSSLHCPDWWTSIDGKESGHHMKTAKAENLWRSPECDAYGLLIYKTIDACINNSNTCCVQARKKNDGTRKSVFSHNIIAMVTTRRTDVVRRRQVNHAANRCTIPDHPDLAIWISRETDADASVLPECKCTKRTPSRHNELAV